MPQRPISPAEAEAYELPLLPGSSRQISSSDYKRDDTRGGHQDEVEDRLGSGRKSNELEEEEALLDEAPDYIGEVREEEIVGKGTKIEQLIADVGWLSLSLCI
jgi:hypothetical protein